MAQPISSFPDKARRNQLAQQTRDRVNYQLDTLAYIAKRIPASVRGSIPTKALLGYGPVVVWARTSKLSPYTTNRRKS